MTELVFIMDKSGSMAGRELDVIGGFNTTIQRQKDEKAEGVVTSVAFSNDSEIVIDRVPLNEVRLMEKKDYIPAGCTAMYDAIGFTIEHISKVQKYIRKEDKPEKTIVIITTDGMENASNRYNGKQIRKMIEQKKEEGWEFLFLAANIDAAINAEAMGIDEECAVDYHNDSAGTAKLFRSVGNFIHQVMACEERDDSWRAEIDQDFNSRH